MFRIIFCFTNMTLFSFHVNKKSRSTSPDEIEFGECCEVDSFPFSAQASSGPVDQSSSPESEARKETRIRTEVTSFFDQVVSPVHTTEGREKGEENEGNIHQEEEEES